LINSNNNDRLSRIEAIIESNARTIQAMLERAEEDRLKREEEKAEQERRMARLEEIAADVATTQRAVVRMLASLDEDRPTILRRLMKIEDKVDRLLERNQE
jgi:hypothetical protein